MRRPDSLLTAAALAARLGISTQTVNDRRRAGRIPFVPLGSKLFRYDPEAVLAALEVRPSEPVAVPTPGTPAEAPDLKAWAQEQQQRERRGVAG